jgi:hypothetical protein
MTTVIIIVVIIIVLAIACLVAVYYDNVQQAKMLDRQYGELTKNIVISSIDIKDSVRIYAKSRIVWMRGTAYSFSQISGVSMEVQTKTEGGDIVATTKTSTLGTAGRAAVGRMVGGDTGALIGAGTATKTTTIHKKDAVQHDIYIVDIHIDSLATPVQTFTINGDRELAMDLYSTIDYIVKRG